jgi:ribosome modulation factor
MMSDLTPAQKRCFNEGFEASMAGKSIKDCPYDDARAGAWLLGFDFHQGKF